MRNTPEGKRRCIRCGSMLHFESRMKIHGEYNPSNMPPTLSLSPNAFQTCFLASSETLVLAPSTPTTLHNPSSLCTSNIISRVLDKAGRAGGLSHTLRGSAADHVPCRGSVLLHLGSDLQADWTTKRSRFGSTGFPLAFSVLLGESVRMVATLYT